jgi:hypothetical protein
MNAAMDYACGGCQGRLAPRMVVVGPGVVGAPRARGEKGGWVPLDPGVHSTHRSARTEKRTLPDAGGPTGEHTPDVCTYATRLFRPSECPRIQLRVSCVHFV